MVIKTIPFKTLSPLVLSLSLAPSRFVSSLFEISISRQPATMLPYDFTMIRAACIFDRVNILSGKPSVFYFSKKTSLDFMSDFLEGVEERRLGRFSILIF